MEITRLKSIGRRGRVGIFLDGKFGFAVNRRLISDFSLFTGRKLDIAEVDRIKTEDIVSRFYEMTLNLIARRPRSEFEIRKYLERKLYKESNHQKLAQAVIKKLKAKQYLDDEKFAAWWVDNRVKFKPRGKYLILQELRSKGIEREVIEKALKIGGLNKDKEYEMALELGRKRKGILGGIRDDKLRKRWINFLLRKGFSYEVVVKVLKKLGSRSI